MDSSAKTLIVDPREFFQTSLSDAEVRLKVNIPDDVRIYLVSLLVEFINPKDKVEMLGDENFLESSLFDILQKAEETTFWAEKLSLLRCMGDFSLYISGYFQDYFNRKLFDIRYYIDMGQLAYHSAAVISEKHGNSTQHPYKNLSETFPTIVDLLAEAAEKTRVGMTSDTNLLSLYDRWNRSKSIRLMKLLQEAGIDPINVPLKHAQ